MTKCEICLEWDVDPEHELSPKHIRNQSFSDYAVKRKKLSGNRKGVVICCSVKSSFRTVVNSEDLKTKISTKPNEGVKFKFTIKNNTNNDKMQVLFANMMHKALGFQITNQIGTNHMPKSLEPKQKLKKDVFIDFKSSEIGQYEMPMLFKIRNETKNETIVVIREIAVVVEEKETKYVKVASPYTKGEVKASLLVKKVTKKKNSEPDNFRIPPNYKGIFGAALNVKEDDPPETKLLAEDLKNLFNRGLTEENYVRYFHSLLWYEETIARLNLKNYNMSGIPLLHLKGKQKYSMVVPGLAEKRPSLMLGDVLFVKPQQDDIMFEAEICLVGENTIDIRGFHPSFESYFSFEARFDVRFFTSRLPLERMHHALHSALDRVPQRLFPVADETRIERVLIHKYFNPQVSDNLEQCVAVTAITSGAGAAPYLLLGPPGTGKTVTIVEAILQLVSKNHNNRIMVCTESNMAADHVGMMLLKYRDLMHENIGLLRANSRFRDWGSLPDDLTEFSNGSNYISHHNVPIAEFQGHNIVITTLSHAAKYANEMERRGHARHITHLFIDEAATASEPASLIPTVGLLAPHGKVVLAGDPQQLGPVFTCHHAVKIGLGLSLMERLHKTCELYSEENNDPDYSLMLRNNFRSHPDILELPNLMFYKNQLRPMRNGTEDPISQTDILTGTKGSRAIVFHGVLSKEQRMGKSPSFFNDMEIEIVSKYVTALVTDHKVCQEDIGIIAPYIRQVCKIKMLLRKMSYEKVEVGTVESFQGKEKRVMIISTVRANSDLFKFDAKYRLGFLVDDKRFNVALTRAISKVIVIGNPVCLRRDKKWRDYMQKCRKYGTYLGFGTEMYDENGEMKQDILDTITPLLEQIKLDE